MINLINPSIRLSLHPVKATVCLLAEAVAVGAVEEPEYPCKSMEAQLEVRLV